MTDQDPTAAFEAALAHAEKGRFGNVDPLWCASNFENVKRLAAGYTARATTDAGRIAELERALRSAPKVVEEAARKRWMDGEPTLRSFQNALSDFARSAITKQAPNEG